MKRVIVIIVKAFACFSAVSVVLFFAFYLMTIGDYMVPRTVSDDTSLPRLTINNRLLHAETFGDAADPVVIVVHGGPGWDYRGLLPLKELSDQYYVVFYDQQGTGLSERVDPKELTLDSTLRDLDSIVDHFGKGKKVALIGHSWGAMLVSGYLGRHPEKVGHAVLAEPGFLTTEMMKTSGVRFGPRWEAGFLLRAAKAWFQSLHIKGADKDVASDYFLGQVAPYANTEYYCGGILPDVAVIHWRTGSKAALSILRSVMDEKGEIRIDLVAGLDHFTSPVLFLVSECNSLTGVMHQKKQMKFFPNAKAEIVNGSGHSMFGEKSEESIRIVRNYLNDR